MTEQAWKEKSSEFLPGLRDELGWPISPKGRPPGYGAMACGRPATAGPSQPCRRLKC